MTPTVIVKVSVSLAPFWSVQTISIVEVPTASGVPENTPVAGLKESQEVVKVFSPKFHAVHVNVLAASASVQAEAL